MIEAWAPTRESCLREAVAAFVSLFAEPKDRPVVRSVPFSFGPETDRELLIQLLEEVLYLVEVLGVIPVDCEVQATEEGGLAGFFEVVPVASAGLRGAVPKAITRHGLVFGEQNGQWSCKLVVDV